MPRGTVRHTVTDKDWRSFKAMLAIIKEGNDQYIAEFHDELIDSDGLFDYGDDGFLCREVIKGLYGFYPGQ
jgi:hypothetical protein